MISRDAAARAFAQGFYDAVGVYLRDLDNVQVQDGAFVLATRDLGQSRETAA